MSSSSALQQALGGAEAAAGVDLRDLLRETEEHCIAVIEQLERESAQRPDRRQECDELVARLSQQVSRWRRATNVALDADGIEREEQERRLQFCASIEAQLDETRRDLDDVRSQNSGIQREIDRLERRSEGR